MNKQLEVLEKLSDYNELYDKLLNIIKILDLLQQDEFYKNSIHIKQNIKWAINDLEETVHNVADMARDEMYGGSNCRRASKQMVYIIKAIFENNPTILKDCIEEKLIKNGEDETIKNLSYAKAMCIIDYYTYASKN